MYRSSEVWAFILWSPVGRISLGEGEVKGDFCELVEFMGRGLVTDRLLYLLTGKEDHSTP